ncbi:MAG: transcription termination/antitermination factor NusG [Clostridia bacterium]|nr:transcription termination/antitermination factor NusG [Clostridia bacterium]
MAGQAKWYVIHTYSGYEKKVEANIWKLIENRNLQDVIIDTRVPEEEDNSAPEKKGAKVKIFPGYVFIKMVMSDDTWHAIRGIRGVTGFVGPESKAVALTEQELINMKLEKKAVEASFAVGDTVNILEGPLAGYTGKVIELSEEQDKVKMLVDLFGGRETEVDLRIDQVEPLS